VTSLAVITPSYARDFELCRDLNRSVLEWTPPEVDHHLIVPTRDLKLFGRLRAPRTRVWTVDEMLPRRIRPVPKTNAWLNLRRPYPPIRGWVAQQLVKLHAAANLGAEVLVLADSDVVFVRPVTLETFRREGLVRFYRSDNAVDTRLPRHLIWHRVAGRLLGLPPAGPPPLPDYVSAVNAWDRQVVLGLRDRIEEVTGRPWLDAIAAELHVSECILYGVFVDRVLKDSAEVNAEGSMLCHTYYEETPLAPASAAGFVDALAPEDVAVSISAKSGTPLDVRRGALSGLASGRLG
jgi:hypothetical protein